MKRWPILISFVLFVGLCASGTFWALQFFKPAARPVIAPKQRVNTEIDPEAAIDLFGGRLTAVAATTNFQLKGVVVARDPAESIAILIPDGKPAIAVRVDSDVIPGVKVTEVHPKYVLLSEGGAVKRVELPLVATPSRPESPIATNQAPVVAPPVPPPANPPGAPPAEGEAPPQNTLPGHIGRPGIHN
jgi:general secretion pathway protein C